jgi:hypothetical protein
MTVKITNNGFSTLASGINNSATTVALASGEGARFPTLTTGNYFYGTLIDTSNNLEIVKVTARSTDSLTVVRAQDNTSARAFSTGDRFELRPVAKLFEDIQAEARPRKTATPLIVNGDMAIAQRGTSTASVTGFGVHAVDRFKTILSSAGTFTISQSTDVPSGQGFLKSLKYDCTTADASLAAANYNFLQYNIEGQDIAFVNYGTSSAESLTLSFWVKSNKTGTYNAELRISGSTNFNNIQYTISSADTWEKKVISFVGNTATALTNTNTSTGIEVNLWLGAGSDSGGGTNQGNAWHTTAANRAVGNVNIADSTSNEWYITGFQLEVGNFDSNSIPAFQFEDRGTSLARCQRYFQSVSGAYYSLMLVRNTDYIRASNYPFKTTMRATPTVTITSSNADSASSLGSGNVTTDNLRFSCTGNETAGPRINAFTMEAEL